MMQMTWEQKLAAIKALAEYDTYLCMREPGNWYVHTPCDVATGAILEGRYGNGETPEAAVEDHWRQWITLADEMFAVRVKDGERFRYVRWNGFMWVDVPRDSLRDAAREAAA